MRRGFKSVIMSERSNVLLFTIVAYLSSNVQCRELLNDFLDFQDQSSKIFLTRTCADDLRILRDAIAENKVWALKGNENC